ncbi:hypothetical protein SAMN04488077_103105 [Roseovarius tolerans]|uniref:SGNH hydrolase-type esterase domain-containing protein n=1 Tax=Roseovarius tolerans TaxID=74031 RepID=A0A1H7WR19_9RHOB|nr:SGNH/GDSL hydrolase family protein [Roseovarius tolerans]SEM23824.1 hypothetical protein SAMN04488077_103105 [Roseovarius tolerans]
MKHSAASFFRVCLVLTCAIAWSAKPARSFETPDILVLGDSQITFGAGPAYLAFFQSLSRRCASQTNWRQRQVLRRLKATAIIGVRSTALREWSARSTKGKADVCKIHPRFKRNAGAFGTVNREREKYVQIGVGPDFQFCKPGLSPMEAAITPGYYQPKLLVLSFLGNAAADWAADPATAQRDVRRAISQVPKGLPCVFMTTAPSFQSAANKLRLTAQSNVQAAFEQEGDKCRFVGGVRKDTIALMMSNKRNFRLSEQNKVKDPFHPTDRGARRYLKAVKPQLCSAILSALGE